MSGEPQARFRLPTEPPSVRSQQELEAFQALATNALSAARSGAERWRAGLMALVLLITASVYLKGPTDLNGLSSPVRFVVASCFAGGLALAVIGLWFSVNAASGENELIEFDEVIREHGSILGYQLSAAARSSRKMAWSRRLLALAVTVLCLSGAVWWLAPRLSPDNALRARIEIDGTIYCGSLVRNADGSVVLKLAGRDSLGISPDLLSSVRIVAAC